MAGCINTRSFTAMSKHFQMAWSSKHHDVTVIDELHCANVDVHQVP